MHQNRPLIVLLASPRISTNIVFNALREEFGDVPVVLEHSRSRLEMAMRRRKKLGLRKVLGQVLFVAGVVPFLRLTSARRIREICQQYAFDASPIPQTAVTWVDSVNSEECRKSLQEIQRPIVVVTGTRIIGRKTLECIQAQFVNMHAGITPAFRGVHGGYWAASLGRPELAGTTIHLMDTGIDTGKVLKQGRIPIVPRGTFVTYPFLHLAVGIPLLIRAIRELDSGHVVQETVPSDLPSRLWSHPTIWEYLSGQSR